MSSSISSISYTWVSDLSRQGTLDLFSRASQIKKKLKAGERIKSLKGRQIALLFNEPSTRTKLSFQMAAHRLGAQCLIIDDFTTSSMSKGETFLDTLWTLHSLGPDLMVVRCGNEELYENWVSQIDLPVINGGWGAKSHPTQALLDVFTLLEQFKTLDGLKVVFVGDIDHSRVAASSIKLLQIFGAEVRVCAPSGFCEKRPKSVPVLETLKEAITWCDVYFGLRVQLERHEGAAEKSKTFEQFQKNFSLDQQGLQALGKKAVILHPGPINWGVEFQDCVEKDSRLLVRRQVENGIYVRAALMESFLEKR